MTIHDAQPKPQLAARFSRPFILALASIALMMLAPGTLAASAPITRIKIATVPDEYMPTNVTMREPVSLQEFHFEVNTETKRARVFVGYTYPDEVINDRDDDNGGPAPTVEQIPGLDYDAAAHEVVYGATGDHGLCGRPGTQRTLRRASENQEHGRLHRDRERRETRRRRRLGNSTL